MSGSEYDQMTTAAKGMTDQNLEQTFAIVRDKLQESLRHLTEHYTEAQRAGDAQAMVDAAKKIQRLQADSLESTLRLGRAMQRNSDNAQPVLEQAQAQLQHALLAYLSLHEAEGNLALVAKHRELFSAFNFAMPDPPS